jgi:hypothetical protein
MDTSPNIVKIIKQKIKTITFLTKGKMKRNDFSELSHAQIDILKRLRERKIEIDIEDWSCGCCRHSEMLISCDDIKVSFGSSTMNFNSENLDHNAKN